MPFNLPSGVEVESMPGLPTDRLVKCYSCMFCGFWQGDQTSIGPGGKARPPAMGECHRSPPILQDDGVSRWPSARYYDWCGEFKKEKKAQAAA